MCKSFVKRLSVLIFDNSVTIEIYRIHNFISELKGFGLIPEIMFLIKIYFTEIRI